MECSRWIGKAGLLACLAMLLQSGVTSVPGLPRSTVPVAQAAAQTISSSLLSVSVDDTFPKINQYTWISSGAVLYGQEDAVQSVVINGTAYTPTVAFTRPNSSTAQYTLTIAPINVVLTVQIKVTQHIVSYDVTGITENGATKVTTLDIPSLNVLSVRSNQSGASFSGAKMYTNVSGSGDTFQSVEGSPAADAAPVDFMYAIVNTNQLAGSMYSNSIYESSDNNGRIKKRTVAKSGYSRTALTSGAWLYRANGMTSPDPLPSVKIAITPDANSDGKVDWQDGAIVYRDIVPAPLGSDQVPDRVVQRLAMNFASQATNPFTQTLDETKRVYLATDGLGQQVLLKGYGSEGHDSAHPDYGSIGQRQGGAAELNTLTQAGSSYNAYYGVHINGTESYPEAKAFNETLVDKTKYGWDWLDASFYINKRYDSTSGNRLARLQELKSKAPNLSFIYMDVWQNNGWDSRKAAREVNSMGWSLATEFPMDFEQEATWVHWAVDRNYGGTSIKGFNSQIARFMMNHQKDSWIAQHPLLGGAEIDSYEGWQGKNSFQDMINTTFRVDLPTKFLQHYKIMKWSADTIALTGGVTVSNATGSRVITKNGKKILDGGAYLLPWKPDTEDKLYHWNTSGGATTWALPGSWGTPASVKLYRLSDLGRTLVGDLTVTNGQITIQAQANTAYVITKAAAPATPDMKWGEGTPMKDPGFNSGSLSLWSVTGSGASVQRNSAGQYELHISSSSGTTVNQQLTGLTQGTYAASVYVTTSGGRKAVLGVNNYGGGPEVSAYADSSLWKNYIAADAKRNTNMQRMYVFFDVPAGATTANLFLKAESGSQTVIFDDVRVVKTVKPANPTGAYFVQDFEQVPSGLYPFVKGPAGGTNDPRVHLSELHAPYTQKGWNGKQIDDVLSGNWSLKAHKEAQGLLLQTIPQTLRFAPGTTYTIEVKYQSETAGDYAFVTGDGSAILTTTPLPAATSTAIFTKTMAGAASGNSWFGIQKVNGNQTDLVLDDLKVTIGGMPGSEPSLIPQSQMSASATSEETASENNAAANVLDGDVTTKWHTKWNLSQPLPQSITLNLGGAYAVKELRYLPRQDGNSNGIITGYNVYTSLDGTSFTKAASGTWAQDATSKAVVFASPLNAAYVRLEATSGGGGYASAAELHVLKSGLYSNSFNNGIAGWTKPIGSGTIAANAGRLELNALNSSTVAVDANAPSRADGVFSMKVTPQNNAGRIQAVFRYSSSSSWAAIGYDTGTTWAWSNGAGQYGTFTGPSLASGTTYDMKVQYIGTSVKLWLNGALIYNGTLTNIPLNAGTIGVRSWNAGSMLIDDVLVDE